MYDQDFSNACAVTGVLQAPAAAAWSISPNPAKGFVTVRYPDLSVREIRLFDATGRLAGQWLDLPEKSTTIDTGRLPDGIYFMQIRTSLGQSTRKIVLEQ